MKQFRACLSILMRSRVSKLLCVFMGVFTLAIVVVYLAFHEEAGTKDYIMPAVCTGAGIGFLQLFTSCGIMQLSGSKMLRSAAIGPYYFKRFAPLVCNLVSWGLPVLVVATKLIAYCFGGALDTLGDSLICMGIATLMYIIPSTAGTDGSAWNLIFFGPSYMLMGPILSHINLPNGFGLPLWLSCVIAGALFVAAYLLSMRTAAYRYAKFNCANVAIPALHDNQAE